MAENERQITSKDLENLISKMNSNANRFVDSLGNISNEVLAIRKKIGDFHEEKDGSEVETVELGKETLDPKNDKTVFGEINATAKAILLQMSDNNEDLVNSVNKLSETIINQISGKTETVRKESSKPKVSVSDSSRTLKNDVATKAKNKSNNVAATMAKVSDGLNKKVGEDTRAAQRSSFGATSMGQHLTDMGKFKNTVTGAVVSALVIFHGKRGDIAQKHRERSATALERIASKGTQIPSRPLDQSRSNTGNKAENEAKEREKREGGVSGGIIKSLASSGGKLLTNLLMKTLMTFGAILVGLIMVALLPYVKNILEGMKPIINALIDIGGVLWDVAKTIVETLKPVFKALVPAVTTILGVVRSVLDVTLKAIKPVLETVAKVVIKLLPIVTWLVKAAGEIVKFAVKIIGPCLNFLVKLVGWTVDGIVLIGKGIGALWDAIVKVLSVPVKIISAVVGGIFSVVKGIVSGIAAVISAPFRLLFAAGRKAVGLITAPIHAVGGVLKAITKPIDIIVSFVKKIFGGLAKVALGVVGILAFFNIKNIANAVWEGVKNLGKMIGDAFSGIVSKIFFWRKKKDDEANGGKQAATQTAQAPAPSPMPTRIETPSGAKKDLTNAFAKPPDVEKYLKAYKEGRLKEVAIDELVERKRQAMDAAKRAAKERLDKFMQGSRIKEIAGDVKVWMNKKRLWLAEKQAQIIKTAQTLAALAREKAARAAAFLSEKAQAAKTIAINIGKAIARAVVSIAGLPFPLNLLAGGAVIAGIVGLGALAYKMIGGGGKSVSASGGGGVTGKVGDETDKATAKEEARRKKAEERETKRKQKEEEREAKRKQKAEERIRRNDEDAKRREERIQKMKKFLWYARDILGKTPHGIVTKGVLKGAKWLGGKFFGNKNKEDAVEGKVGKDIKSAATTGADEGKSATSPAVDVTKKVGGELLGKNMPHLKALGSAFKYTPQGMAVTGAIKVARWLGDKLFKKGGRAEDGVATRAPELAKNLSGRAASMLGSAFKYTPQGMAVTGAIKVAKQLGGKSIKKMGAKATGKASAPPQLELSKDIGGTVTRTPNKIGEPQQPVKDAVSALNKAKEAADRHAIKNSEDMMAMLKQNLSEIKTSLSDILRVIPESAALSAGSLSGNSNGGETVDVTGSEMSSYRMHYLNMDAMA